MNQLAPRHRGRMAVVVATVILALALAGYAITRPSATSTAAQDTATTPIATAPAAPDDSTAPPGSILNPEAPAPAVQLPPGSALDQQVRRFAEAYFLIEPDDTEVSRRDRVTGLGLAATGALPMLDFSLNSNEREYQRLGIAQRAELDTRTMTADPVNDGSNQLQQVSLPVTVAWFDSSGNQIGSYVVDTVSQWNFDGSTWTMTGFSPEEGG